MRRTGKEAGDEFYAPRTRRSLALEDLWKERLGIARTRYQLATRQSRLLLDEQKSGLTPEPDGPLAYRQALEKEKTALAEYRRVLEIFADLTVHDKLPEDDAAAES